MSKALSFLKNESINSEIAFFGGSFTAIDKEYMLELLDATKPYIDKFKGIRISTRPDCINEQILQILKSYKVTSIELGAQSMNDDVLKANDRGHTSNEVYKASELIKKHGFSLGLQMMTGLYKSTYELDIDTARQFISIKPDTVRIYPTITMKNTKLHKLYLSNEYTVSSIEDSVSLCAQLLQMFEDNNIKVIRLGLHHSESLIKDMVAGPYHPAFRELCESQIMYNKLLALLDSADKKNTYTVLVSGSCVSKMIGNKKSNIKKLFELGYNINIVQSDSMEYMDVALI